VLFVAYFRIVAASIPPWWLIGLVGSTLGAFPCHSFTCLKARVLGIRLIVRRGLSYALVSRGFLAVEALVIFAAFFFGPGLCCWP